MEIQQEDKKQVDAVGIYILRDLLDVSAFITNKK